MITLLLLQQCTKDDRKAHYELYKASFACMYRVCSRYYNNQADIKSGVNMVFLKVVTNLDSFLAKEKSIDTFEFWMSRIAINYIIDDFRKNKRYREAIHHAEDMSLYQVAEVDETENREEMQPLLLAIEKLPLIARTIFTLYAIDGYKHKEIATLMNITESTSKVHYYKAKIKLRELITNNKAASTLVMLLCALN
jgi:RNA polymerase sigma-70 factor (ECF subfamily)